MTEREYKRLRRQAIADYEQKKAGFEADHRKRLEALDIVWRMASGEVQRQGRASQTGKGDVLQAVREATGTLKGVFSLRQVMRHLAGHHPELVAKPASVSSALKRLAASNEITLVALGAGKRASTYVTRHGRQQAEEVADTTGTTH